ncbi:MAG: hypothetical protein IT359_12105 [Gemmatimonadaceae bacterium]|nr:hypothetical protein [Gemmatimonadaceae bacterium]
MSDWTPDSDDNAADNSGEHNHDGSASFGEGAPAIARVMTLAPVALRLVAIEHPRTPPGHTVFHALAAVEGEVSEASPTLAQGSLPTATFDAVSTVGLFDEPAPILLTARENDGGIRGVLAAVVPQRLVERLERAARAAEEPWLASVEDGGEAPGFESETNEEEGIPHVPFALGIILRFPEDRKHPDSLDEEAIDLLATLLSGQAMDADKKRVENLLKSL